MVAGLVGEDPSKASNFVVVFAAMGVNMETARYFRILNEVPAVLMLGIVILVIVKPF